MRRSYSQINVDNKKSCHVLGTTPLGARQVRPTLQISELRAGEGHMQQGCTS